MFLDRATISTDTVNIPTFTMSYFRVRMTRSGLEFVCQAALVNADCRV